MSADDLTSAACWPDRGDRTDTEHSALLAVLWRIDNAGLTREDARTVLDALGLQGATPAPENRLPSATAQARSRRRAAARERAREEGAA